MAEISLNPVDRVEILILIRCQVETNYPGPSRKAAQAFTVSRQLGQALFQLPSDAGEV